MTNLTETSTYDANISVPDDGEEITAVAAGAGRGPVRPSLQSLANRAKYLKDRIAAVLNGTLSFRALVIDGTGAATVAPTDGSLFVSRTVSGTSVPTATTTVGELARGLVPVAWARVTGTSGALKRAVGVYDCQRTATGVYLITLHALLADPVNYATLVTTELIGGIPIVAPQAAVGGKPQVQITLQAGGSNTDGNFSVAVFGE